jgi:hypothetical protein
MKTNRTSRVLALLAVGTILTWTAAGTSLADDHHDAWSHDKSGYWDDHGRHQAFVEHDHHHGYWRTHDDGSRIFINID